MTDTSRISLRVLGSSGGFPAGGLPCSGYLYRAEGKALLLDCGPGVATTLLAENGRSNLDAVLISHIHPDHVLDLIPLGYAMLTEWTHDGRTQPLSLYMPRGGRAFLTQLSDLFGHRNWRFPASGGTPGHEGIAAALARGEDWMLTVFDIREYDAGDTLDIHGLCVETLPVDHSVPTAAMKIGRSGRQLVYSADTRFIETLAAFSQGAKVLLADAHLSGPKAPGGAHMSPLEAGRLAALANVETLVLCHLGAPEDGPSAIAEAGTEFGGAVHLAMSQQEYAL